MIKGIGIDLIEIARIRKAHERLRERFLNKIFTQAEQDYCFGFKDPYPQLAARFAAKEACAKALQKGIGRELGWQDMEVVKESSGAPLLRFHGKIKQELEGCLVHLSLTHAKETAAAMVVIDQTDITTQA